MHEFRLAIQIMVVCLLTTVLGYCIGFAAKYVWADEMSWIWDDD